MFTECSPVHHVRLNAQLGNGGRKLCGSVRPPTVCLVEFMLILHRKKRCPLELIAAGAAILTDSTIPRNRGSAMPVAAIGQLLLVVFELLLCGCSPYRQHNRISRMNKPMACLSPACGRWPRQPKPLLLLFNWLRLTPLHSVQYNHAQPNIQLGTHRTDVHNFSRHAQMEYPTVDFSR